MGDIIIDIPRHIYQGEQHPSFLQRGKSLTKKKILLHVTWEIYLCKGHKVSALIKTNKKKTSFKVVLKN